MRVCPAGLPEKAHAPGLGTFATLFLLFIAAGAIASVLQLALIGLIIWGVLFRTRETVGLQAGLALLGFVNRCPWAFAWTIALAVFIKVLAGKAGETNRAVHADPAPKRLTEHR